MVWPKSDEAAQKMTKEDFERSAQRSRDVMKKRRATTRIGRRKTLLEWILWLWKALVWKPLVAVLGTTPDACREERRRKMNIDSKQISDAAKLDILALFEKEAPGIFEFRRMTEIAQIVCDLFGAPREHAALDLALRRSEHSAPTLHAVLLGVAFDGDALLNDRYRDMLEKLRKLRTAKAQLDNAADQLRIKEAQQRATDVELKAIARSLERERESLQLVAETKGLSFEVPEIPEELLLEADAVDGGAQEGDS